MRPLPALAVFALAGPGPFAERMFGMFNRAIRQRFAAQLPREAAGVHERARLIQVPHPHILASIAEVPGIL